MFTDLFQAPKNTPDEVAAAASSCFKLNSLQLQCLLMKYQYEPEEIPIPPEVLDNVVRVSVHFVFVFCCDQNAGHRGHCDVKLSSWFSSSQARTRLTGNKLMLLVITHVNYLRNSEWLPTTGCE